MNLTSQKKVLLLLCACLFLPLLGLAQTDFRKGFIITHEKDTVFGLANFYDGIKAYDVCHFKRTEKEESKSYSPADINGYGINDGRKYVSKTIVLKADSITAFLEVLASGHVSLYRYRETFWVDKEGNNLTQLRDDLVDRELDGDRYRAHSNAHISTLTILMADCSDVLPLIQKVPLYQRNLVDVVESYNHCREEGATIRSVGKPWIRLISGISGGVAQSMMDGEDMKVIFGDEVVQEGKSGSPMFGISLDVASPRISERFLFTTSLWYTPSTYYLTSAEKRQAMQYVVIDIDALKLPFGIRYTFAPRVITPFLNAGVSMTFHLESSSSWMMESIANNTVFTYDKGEVPLKSTQLGIWGGVGFLTRLSKKFDAVVEFRYERTDGIIQVSQLKQYSSHVTNLQLLFGLRMNKVQ